MPRQHVVAKLITALETTIGRESAHQELKWMKQSSGQTLEAMLQRRARGEPLQYVLGGV